MYVVTFQINIILLLILLDRSSLIQFLVKLSCPSKIYGQKMLLTHHITFTLGHFKSSKAQYGCLEEPLVIWHMRNIPGAYSAEARNTPRVVYQSIRALCTHTFMHSFTQI